VNRATLPSLGYLYVALALPAFIVSPEHLRLAATLYTGALFAYLWFVASLRAKLVRFEPDGFYASAVVLGSAAFAALQARQLVNVDGVIAAPAAACAATVIVASSLAAWRARKIPKWFGQAGVAGGIAVLAVGLVEGADDWTLWRHDVHASTLGFMVWVIVTATYLLRR
jgi:hypothetical protein